MACCLGTTPDLSIRELRGAGQWNKLPHSERLIEQEGCLGRSSETVLSGPADPVRPGGRVRDANAVGLASGNEGWATANVDGCTFPDRSGGWLGFA